MFLATAWTWISVPCISAYIVDHSRSKFVDGIGRERLWHGVNFVQKSEPYFPTITDDELETVKSMGFFAVRLGVMMPGVFPKGPNVNVTYLDAIGDIVDRLHANDIETIIDLHQ